MARNSMTFNASLRLNSSGFKKGVNEVKSALAGLKSSFLSLAGALGAGLGLTQFVSSMKDTAVQLSVAQNVLKNVSKVTKEYTDGINKGKIEISNYGENLAYVRQLAKDYSQDLIGLTENFAKFHAACDKTNLSLEQQKDVFEALTRAAAYYHMSADQTNDMTLAVTQMMSKGKVTSEELRRQLGNSLPGAFNLMAAAIGVTTAQLEDMMKKGQVISSEVLPRFAAMLNTVTKNADFDSLQMSINRLKNTWTDFVEKSGAEGVFQGVVDGANNLLAVITRNINEITSLIKGLIAAIVGSKVLSYLEKRGQEYFAGLEKGLAQATKAYKKYAKDLETIQEKVTINKSTGAATPNKKSAAIVSKADLDRMIAYNQELARLQRAQNTLNNGKAGSRVWMLDEGDIAKLEAANAELMKAQATINNTAKQSRGWLATIGGGIKSIGLQIKSVIASMGIVTLASAIIGVLTSIISYIKKIKDEQKKVNNLVNDYKKSLELSNQSVQENARMLKKNLQIMQDETKNNPQIRVAALKEINKLMGTSFSTDALDKTKQAYKDIIAEVYRWIEATKTQARIQVLLSKATEAEIEIEKINIRNSELKKEREKLSKGLFTGFKLGKIEIEESINAQAIKQYEQIIALANKELDDLQVKWLDLVDLGNGGGGGGGETDINKVFKKYNEDLKELENKLKEHAITQEEYNEEFDKLVTKFYEEAAGTGKMSIDKILEKLDKGKTLTKLEKWYKDLYDAAQQAAFNNTARAISDAITKSIEDAVDEAEKKADEEIEKWLERTDKATKANIDALTTDKPKRDKRDTTFDYNKTGSAILGENLDTANNYAKNLEETINKIISQYDKLEDASEAVKAQLAEWKAELALAKKEAATLEEAMKLSKIQEDIDELNKSISETVYGGIKNMATSMDRVIKGMETLKNTIEDDDADGWEVFMAVFNEMVQIIETITSAYQSMQTIQQATAKLEQAEIALAATKISLMERELELRRAIAAERAKEKGETTALIAAEAAEAAAAEAAASANAKEAVAGAAASGSKLPFPYNLAAIATGIAAVLGALAAMQKFAKGGIVGGNSYSGDKQLARVNSGEMVLNKAQQANLWSIINGKSGAGGQVNFKIRGTDLIGVMNNELSRRKG